MPVTPGAMVWLEIIRYRLYSLTHSLRYVSIAYYCIYSGAGEKLLTMPGTKLSPAILRHTVVIVMSICIEVGKCISPDTEWSSNVCALTPTS